MENNENVYSHVVKYDSKLFVYLKEELILSYRQTNTFLENGQIKLNGMPIRRNGDIRKKDFISLHFLDEKNEYEPEYIPLTILYESDDLLIIHKPPFILVHPTDNYSEHTIANAVSYYFNSKGLKRKIRFVNRLDRDTSGILVIAKNPYSHGFLAKQFETNTISKIYLAIVNGHLETKNGVIETKIKKRDNDILYEANDGGLPVKTLYRVLKEYDNYSLILCELKSGRTHQIRVSLKEIGAYILGDSLYNQKCELIDRQALHAYKLSFIEPRTFNKKEIICELPEDMKKLL